MLSHLSKVTRRSDDYSRVIVHGIGKKKRNILATRSGVRRLAIEGCCVVVVVFVAVGESGLDVYLLVKKS